MSDHDPPPNTTQDSQDRGYENLSIDDIKLVKNFIRAFKSIEANTRPGEDVTQSPKAALEDYMLISNALKQEIRELLLQLGRVGGHETDPIAKHLKVIIEIVPYIDDALLISLDEPERLTNEVMAPLRNLELACSALLKSLYRQNHAFRFLQRLVEVLIDSQDYIVGQSNVKAELSTANMKAELSTTNTKAELSTTNTEAELSTSDTKAELSTANTKAELSTADTKAELLMILRNVIQHLKFAFAALRDDFRSFSDKTLPRFVVEEEERATTRYLTLTTIAIFFSSITATTLQFSFAGETKPLSGIVNLFWYLSLVFSVSSGINSLLSMLWRKSAVYSDERRPPDYIKLWLTEAPIYFLAISAFAFIFGLSLFVYSSNQPTYVASTAISFTAIHILGILIVMSWFLVRRKWSTLFVQCQRRNLLWIFLLDDEVIDANRFIGGITNWPPSISSPNHLVMLLRHFMILLQACSRSVEQYFLAPIRDIYTRMKGTGSKTARMPVGDQEAGVGDRKANKGDRKAGIGDGKAGVGDREAGVGDRAAGIGDREAGVGDRAVGIGDRAAGIGDRAAGVGDRAPEVGDRATGVGNAEAHSEKQDPSWLEVRRVAEEFKSALRDTFGGQNAIAVVDFEKRFRDWQRPSYHLDAIILENTMRSILWGYPGLLQQFQTEVYPAMLRREAIYKEELGLKSGSQGTGTAGNHSSVNHSPRGSATVEAEGQGGDEALKLSPPKTEQSELTHKASPGDAGPSARSLVAGFTTGDRQNNTAREPLSLRNVIGEKGSRKEQREEGPGHKSQSVTKSREGLQSK